MSDSSAPRSGRYRVWKVRHATSWRPTAWDEIPPDAVAVEPAAGECLAAEEARLFLAGFNQAMLTAGPLSAPPDEVPTPSVSDPELPLWAVAVPVEVEYRGDLRRGDRLSARQLKLP